jgi:hypothetical protein
MLRDGGRRFKADEFVNIKYVNDGAGMAFVGTDQGSSTSLVNSGTIKTASIAVLSGNIDGQFTLTNTGTIIGRSGIFVQSRSRACLNGGLSFSTRAATCAASSLTVAPRSGWPGHPLSGTVTPPPLRAPS